MYCLDTNIIISLFDGREDVKSQIEKINFGSTSISPITLCELYKGTINSKVTEKRLKSIEGFLQENELLDFNELACKIFGEDYLKLKRLGKPISESDLMIAAICKSHNKILITRDKTDFLNIPDLKLEVW